MPIQSELINEGRADNFTNAFFKPALLTDVMHFEIEGRWKDSKGDVDGITMSYQVPLQPEIVISGSSDLKLHAAGLNTSLAIQNSHSAVTAILDRIEIIKELVLLERPSQLPVNYTFVEVNYDFKSDHKWLTDKSNLAENINRYAKFLYSHSGLSKQGVKIEDINLVIGCDHVVHRILEASLNAFKIFAEPSPFANWKIVSSPDKRMVDQIIFTFDIPSKTEGSLPSLYNFGYHAYFKGDIYLGEEARTLKIGRGKTFSESADKIIFQNRSIFINTMPILGLFNISNVETLFPGG